VKPLQLLHEQALRLGAGDFDARLILNTHDELEMLAQVLNEAAQRLQEARRTERLAVVGQTASTIVHDLKNPLTIIKGLAPLLKRTDLPPQKREEFVQAILEASDRILNLTQDLLDFARGEERLNLKPADLSAFLEQMADKLKREMERSQVQVRVRTEGTLPVEMDPRKMERVLYNLAGNARDAMPQGGLLEIRAFRENGEAVLRFRDTGKGIPSEVVNRIFEPFVTCGKERGTGLGLAICKQIVEAHRGQLRLVETSSGGTTFEVRLPLREAKAS
jgi:signal transduction histidine kinase